MWPTRMAPRSNSRTTCNTTRGRSRVWPSSLENTVRYQASSETGNFPITYTVEDNLGNVASANITITVHKSDAASKAAPTPHDAEAQVAAGQKVRIPITLTGIDTDGDDDQLLGLGNKAPTLGRISGSRFRRLGL